MVIFSLPLAPAQCPPTAPPPLEPGLGQGAPLLTRGPARSKPKQPKPCLSVLVLLLCHSFRSTNSKFLLRLGRGIEEWREKFQYSAQEGIMT